MHILCNDETNCGKHSNTCVLKFSLLKVSKILEVFCEPKRIKANVALRNIKLQNLSQTSLLSTEMMIREYIFTGADPSSAAGLSRNGSALLFSAIMLTEGVTARENLEVVKADTYATHKRTESRKKRIFCYSSLD